MSPSADAQNKGLGPPIMVYVCAVLCSVALFIVHMVVRSFDILSLSLHIYIYTQMCIYIFIYLYIYIYIYIHIHRDKHIYIYIYICYVSLYEIIHAYVVRECSMLRPSPPPRAIRSENVVA